MPSTFAALVDHYLGEWDSRGWAAAYHSLIGLGPAILPELDQRLGESGDGAFRTALVELARALHSQDALPLFARALREPVTGRLEGRPRRARRAGLAGGDRPPGGGRPTEPARPHARRGLGVVGAGGDRAGARGARRACRLPGMTQQRRPRLKGIDGAALTAAAPVPILGAR
jgi:hypothetical protein